MDSTAAYIYYHRAIAYRFSKDYDNALHDLNKAIDLYPDYYLAYNMLEIFILTRNSMMLL